MRAEASELCRERLEFDEEGNLWMTTRDKIATSSVRYKTIGFTIKREEKEIQQTEVVRVRLEETREPLTDPANPQYCYNYFCIKKETICQKIMSCSEAWANELYLKGGTVYLDAIMIVEERGKEKGSMEEDGTFWGEVYETFEGIAAARSWADADSLKTHFNKEIYFAGNPELIEPAVEWEEQRELVTKQSLVQKGDLPEKNTLYFTASAYDVTQAVPSKEAIDADGKIQKLYYQSVFEHIWGNAEIPIATHVHYTLVWDDETHHEEEVTIFEYYKVKREYSYWQIKEISLFYLDNVLIKNTALQEEKRINSTYQPNVEQISETGNAIQLPVSEITVEGGCLYGGARRPVISYGAAAEQVEEAVSQIKVRNDGFSLDGEVYLKGGWYERAGEEPAALEEERVFTINEQAGNIRTEAENAWYETEVTAYYKKYQSGETEPSKVEKTNGIKVHTPVVCSAAVSDEKAWNQQVQPTKYASFVLGRNFTVEIKAAGTHIDKKGYGTKNYAGYVKEYRVCFPFEVWHGTQKIAKNKWISLKGEKENFYLSTNVKEENYNILFQTIAINSGETPKAQENANTNPAYDAACVSIPVTVTGRLSDFKITNIIDYPRWQSVFWNIPKQEKTGICYYSGINNRDGQKERECTSGYLCPVLKGAHPYNANAGAVGLGYEIAFSFRTIGSRAGEKTGVSMKPAYYYIEKNGSGRKKVRLYDKNTLEEIENPFTLKNTAEIPSKSAIFYWEASCRIPPDIYIVPADLDFKAYIRKKGGRIRTKEACFLQDGYLIVNLDITTYYGAVKNLNYRNARNAKNGYCNMWTAEGYQTRRTDAEGTQFAFLQGDVFLFDCHQSIARDYDTFGTH